MLTKTKLNGRKPSPVDIFTQYGLDCSLYTSPNTNFSLKAKCRVRGGVGTGPGESVCILEHCLWINDAVFWRYNYRTKKKKKRKKISVWVWSNAPLKELKVSVIPSWTPVTNTSLYTSARILTRRILSRVFSRAKKDCVNVVPCVWSRLSKGSRIFRGVGSHKSRWNHLSILWIYR